MSGISRPLGFAVPDELRDYWIDYWFENHIKGSVCKIPEKKSEILNWSTGVIVTESKVELDNGVRALRARDNVDSRIKFSVNWGFRQFERTESQSSWEVRSVRVDVVSEVDEARADDNV